MNIEQLRYFKQVCESHSLNKAAQVLFISQPALTKSIHALEKELGATLLVRDKKGVSPTEVGNIVLNNFAQMLSIYDETVDLINNARTFEHPLTIYAVPAISNACGSELIRQLRRKFCYLDIYFEEIMPRDLEKLYQNPVSLALTFSHSKDPHLMDNLPDLSTVTIKEDPIYFFAKSATFDTDFTAKKNNIAFRNFSANDDKFVEDKVAVYCNNATIGLDYMLNKNYVHPIPVSIGRLLYTHPDIEGRPSKPERVVSYKLVAPTQLFSTSYQFVIDEVINSLKRILQQ